MKATMTPILPCADIDEAITFYEVLGFTRTYRQVRPNPYAVVQLGDIHLHFAGIDGFDPEGSYGSAIVAVSEPDKLYEGFAAGLRSAYGKLPSVGIPRILRPRKKHGTVRGFSVVDPGGNWLRFYPLDSEEDPEPTTGLARVIVNAARLADAKGDDSAALELLGNGLERFREAEPVDRVKALLYAAELAVRTGAAETAVTALSDAEAVELSEADRLAVTSDFEHAREVTAGLR